MIITNTNFGAQCRETGEIEWVVPAISDFRSSSLKRGVQGGVEQGQGIAARGGITTKSQVTPSLAQQLPQSYLEREKPKSLICW